MRAVAFVGWLGIVGALLVWQGIGLVRGPDWPTMSDFFRSFMSVPLGRFILFGLGTIQYAKHPEGVIEMMKARSAERRAKKAAKKSSGASPASSTPSSPTPVDAPSIEEPAQ